MSTTTASFISLAEQIKVKNLITVSIDSQFLNMNFQIIKQCLTRLSQLESKFNLEKADRDRVNRQVLERLNYIQKDIAKNKEKLDEHETMMKEIQGNFGDDFKKKLDELNQRAQNHDIENLIKQIEALNKFVSNERFKDFQVKTGEDLDNVHKIKDQLHKFVENQNFKDFKNETEANLKNANNNIQKISEQAKQMDKHINDIDDKAAKASADAEQNNNMVKEINFSEMQQKIKKYKQDTENKLNQMTMKLKKKIGSTELGEVEKNIIEKLDIFLMGCDKPKADREQTKDALSFLQKRINEIYEMLNNGQQDSQMDALFAARKWMCASCTKDLGKYEGKLGQFRPWSIFPCRELDPQKCGGYGYLNYVDKLAYKKGVSVDDSSLQRINKTFFERNSKQVSPKKTGISTHATNLMSNFGTGQKNTTSLKQQYFKNSSRDNGEKGARFFRVRNHSRKNSINDLEKEKAKEL